MQCTERLTSEEKDRENNTGREANTGLDYCIADAEVSLLREMQERSSQLRLFLCRR